MLHTTLKKQAKKVPKKLDALAKKYCMPDSDTEELHRLTASVKGLLFQIHMDGTRSADDMWAMWCDLPDVMIVQSPTLKKVF